jgi:hypothetical protein
MCVCVCVCVCVCNSFNSFLMAVWNKKHIDNPSQYISKGFPANNTEQMFLEYYIAAVAISVCACTYPSSSRLKSKELEGNFRFLLRLSNQLASFLSLYVTW